MLTESKHFDFYADAVNYISKDKGAYVILDPHNYMRYNDPSSQPMSGSVIGNSSDVTAATTKQFGEFWKELAKRFAKNEKVIFSIMNEVCSYTPCSTLVLCCPNDITIASRYGNEFGPR